MNFYNDNDLKICAWLRELIKAKLIPDGVVDSRSIELIQPDELKPYIQCHFFAGIAGWGEALRLAGWPVDAPVWTGSCPCQPYSCAGKGKGDEDPRNVWPHFRRLIEACQPPVVFGEQVASKAGREWLAGVFADLEALGYSRAGADLCAAWVGSPQLRQRLWWVADSNKSFRNERSRVWEQSVHGKVPMVDRLGSAESQQHNRSREARGWRSESSDNGWMGNTNWTGPQGRNGAELPECSDQQAAGAGGSSVWSDFEIIPCRDGKSRRVESGTFPLAHGVPSRVVRLRGYGNAIAPQVAAKFIEAYLAL